MKDYLRVLSYAGGKKPLMRRAIAFLTLSALFSVSTSFIVTATLSSFLGASPPSALRLFWMAAAIFACLLLKNYLNAAGLDASRELARRALAEMRRRVKKNFAENIDEIEPILSRAIPEGFASLIAFAAAIAAVFIVDWRMALAAAFSIALGSIPAALMVSGASKRLEPLYATSAAILLTSALLFMIPAGIALRLGGSISLASFVLSIALGMSAGPLALRLVSFFPQFLHLKYKAAKIESMMESPDWDIGGADV